MNKNHKECYKAQERLGLHVNFIVSLIITSFNKQYKNHTTRAKWDKNTKYINNLSGNGPDEYQSTTVYGLQIQKLTLNQV